MSLSNNRKRKMHTKTKFSAYTVIVFLSSVHLTRREIGRYVFGLFHKILG